MKIKVKELRKLLDLFDDERIIDFNINCVYINENIQSNGIEKFNEEGHKIINKTNNIWLHPILSELGYNKENALKVTNKIIAGYNNSIKYNTPFKNGLPIGIVAYCRELNSKLYSQYHSFDYADSVIKTIIENNK